MRVVFFILCVCLPLISVQAEEEIFVQLSTKKTLLPTYVGAFQQKDAQLSSAYLKSLQAIIAFDFSYNGKTCVIATSKQTQEIPHLEDMTRGCDYARLRAQKIAYVLQFSVIEKKLQCRILMVHQEKAKQIEGIVLSGVLQKDRVVLHQLSDHIFQLLFQEKGIASSKIIFTKKQSMNASLYECDYDGANERFIFSDNSLLVTPCMQQDALGYTLCYVSYIIGQPKIFFVSDCKGKERVDSKRLITLRGNQMTPSISKDQTMIAFSCDASGSTDLFVQRFERGIGPVGKPYQVFSSRGEAAASPSFSPDGKRLVFASGRDGIPKIYMIDIPQAGAKMRDIKPVLISKKCRENSSPVWSPDGRKIAYCARTTGPRQIWVYDVESREEQQITEDSGDKENPCWAVNSCHIAFHQSRGKETELYFVNINQRKQVKITSGTEEKRFPVWK